MAARDWLDANRDVAPPDYGAICPPELIDAGVAWQRRLLEAGYAGIHWPVEHGGRGLSDDHQAAWLVECARAGVPPVLNMVGLVLAGGAILRYGTPAQQDQHLRATLGADHVWCQLFSEPGAGSDLGSLADAGRAGRRPLRRQRPEGVVLRRTGEQLGHPHGAHRSRRPQARRHLLLPLPDGPAGHRGATAAPDDRLGRVRRGVLHRRLTAGRPAARAAARRVGRRDERADERARPHRHGRDLARAAVGADQLAGQRPPARRRRRASGWRHSLAPGPPTGRSPSVARRARCSSSASPR